jgi:uncharacterized membrane protein YcaP (DUF421 family)
MAPSSPFYQMFHQQVPYWALLLRGILVYTVVFLLLRMMGKRELGQMTVFDLVVILLIANAVQNAMTGPDTTVWGGMVVAFVLLVVNRAVASLRRRGGFWGRMIEGTPTILVQNGRFVAQHLHKEGLIEDEVMAAVREHGLESLQQVELAVLEVDGSISIVPAGQQVFRSQKHVRQLKKH